MALSKEKIQLLQVDYEAEEITVMAMTRKHNVSRSTILRLAEKYKWKGRPVKPKKETIKPKKPGKGRPKKYKEDYARQALSLCLIGYTDEEMAEFFSVSVRSIYYWKKEQPDFMQALKEGKTIADAKMVASLFKRGMGYSHKEDKIFQYEGKPLIVPTVKQYPPDTKAALAWLCNRQPRHWRNKQEIETTDKTLKTFIPERSTASSDEDFAKKVAEEITQ